MSFSFGDALVGGAPSRLATVAEDGLLTIYDAVSGELQQQHARPTHLAVQWTCIAFWPQSESLALGTDSGLVVVWNLAVGRIAHELRGHTQRVLDVAYEAGGETLLTCGRDRQVCCWRVASGELLHTFAAGQAPVHRLAPTASAEFVLLGSTALRLMRRDTWKRAGKAPGHASRVACLSLSSDDRLAASAAADDRHVTIWRVTPTELSAVRADPRLRHLRRAPRLLRGGRGRHQRRGGE
jgi:WD40 repeat protein